jgi:hypothetical protein
MEANIFFAAVMVVAGIWFYFSCKKQARLEKQAEQERQERLEAWYQAHPGSRWIEPRPATTTGKLSEGPSWFSMHGPTE